MIRQSVPAVVFFDLDGTLLNEQNQVPDSAVAAIRQLRHKGHLAFLNTGRSLAGVHASIRAIEFDGIVAACGTSIEYHGQLLQNQTIASCTVAKLLTLLAESRIDAIFEGPEHVYFGNLDPDNAMQRYIQVFQGFPGVIQLWNESPVSANKMCFILRPESRIQPLLEYLQQGFMVINHHPDPLYEVLQKGYSKATGIQFLLDHLKLTREQTFAFGDSLNDIEMLNFAGTGIAMGGSRSRVLLASDHVTRSAAEDGIATALQHFGLI